MQQHQLEYEISALRSEIQQLKAKIALMEIAIKSLSTNDITMYDLKTLDENICNCSCELD